MVSSASILAMGFAVFASLVVPVGGAIFFCLSRKLNSRVLLTGMAVYSATQIFLLSPVLNLLAGTAWFESLQNNMFLFALVLVVPSALLQNWGRFLGARTIAKGLDSYADGLAYGFGHGGAEAVAIGASSSINTIMMALSFNKGELYEILAQTPTEQVDVVVEVLTKTPALSFMVSGVERLMVIVIQIALSVMVFYAINRKKTSFVWLAVAAQVVVNLPVALLSGTSVWAVEGYLLLCTILSILFIVRMRPHFSKPQQKAQK